MIQEVKVRYLCQGILTVPTDQLPPGWHEMDAATKWNWLQEWWDAKVTEEMFKEGLIMGKRPANPAPGLLEENDGEEYHTIAQSNEYCQWWNSEIATAMHKE